jgi:hypothetical protein
MRGLPGPQVPPRNPPTSDGKSSSGSSNDRLLSVSGKKKCSHCKEELGRGAAMIIESLRLFYHLLCFRCVVCHVQLGNGSSGTDVRVRNNKLHCQNCYSNDEGLKFSKVWVINVGDFSYEKKKIFSWSLQYGSPASLWFFLITRQQQKNYFDTT